MKVIWAPWRMAYIRNARKPTKCIFCAKANDRHDTFNLLLYRGQHGFVMMNLFPYNSGHLMVAPYAHVKNLESLPTETTFDLIRLTNLSLRVLRTEIKPQGFNVGINVGRVSGAGIDQHIHLHIVPRWNGDTNFMPVFSETRVIPEYLRQTYRKLRARFRLALMTDRRERNRTTGKKTTNTDGRLGKLRAARSLPRMPIAQSRPAPYRASTRTSLRFRKPRT